MVRLSDTPIFRADSNIKLITFTLIDSKDRKECPAEDTQRFSIDLEKHFSRNEMTAVFS